MANEPKRACGYRKIGGLYLMGGGLTLACCAMPWALTVCPTCGGGIKQARGWTWVNSVELFKELACKRPGDLLCPLARPEKVGRAGLLWVGEAYYPTPEHFRHEALTLGISKRIAAVPRGLQTGPHATWVLLAHPKAVNGATPGIFMLFRPTHLERIVRHSEYETAEQWPTDTEGERRRRDAAQGIKWVPVSDFDPDHADSILDDQPELLEE